MSQAEVKRETYTASMSPEQRRIFTKLVVLPDLHLYDGGTIREQFHCSRGTAEAVATALADFRLTPAQRKAKEDAPVVAAPTPRRHLKEITKPGSTYAAFRDEAQEQLERDFPRGGGVWDETQGKWVAYIPK